MTSIDYDLGWETQWNDAKKHGPMSRHIRRKIFEIIHPLQFTTVLDVGCGQGTLLGELGAKYPKADLYGVEISHAALELASQNAPRAQLWPLDIERESISRPFDLVICSEVLEHILDDVAALRNLKQSTGRYLVVSTVQGRMRSFERARVGHVRNYAYGELAQKISDAGFHIKRVVTWGFPFYSPLYRDLLDVTDMRGTTGEFGSGRKVISSFMYYLFMLNSAKRGDEIFVLAEVI